MYASTIIAGYNGVKLWSLIPSKHVDFSNQSAFLSLYVMYLFGLFYYPMSLLYKFDLNCACSFVITCENVRISRIV